MFSRQHLTSIQNWLERNKDGTPAQFFEFLVKQANILKYQIGSYPGEYDLGSLSTGYGAKQGQQARGPAFAEKAQATGLVRTYNSSNPGRPLPQQGKATGQIGGVGLQPGSIAGLKDTMFDLLEDEHMFLLPTQDGRPPFENGALRQIIRELSANILFHGCQPMFSLHFNQDATMYSVIPPEYQDTLVGRVMGMLDYMMKGYLNGGVFTEDFIARWQATRSDTRKDSLGELVDLHAYCEEHLGPGTEYLSLHEMMESMGVSGEDAKQMHHRSSFRIIADNPVVRHQSAFKIGTAFRVEYTIEAPPEQEAIRQRHRAEHGCEPDNFLRLQKAYDAMAQNVRVDMPQLPMCREYFNLLGTIHFFSHYLATLKGMDKVPVLPPQARSSTASFPALLPPLPIRKVVHSRRNINLFDVIQKLSPDRLKRFRAGLRPHIKHACDGQTPSDWIAIIQKIDTGLLTALSASVVACLSVGADGISRLPDSTEAQMPLTRQVLNLMLGRLVESGRQARNELGPLQEQHDELAGVHLANMKTSSQVTHGRAQVGAELDVQVAKRLGDFDRQAAAAVRGFDEQVARQRGGIDDYFQRIDFDLSVWEQKKNIEHEIAQNRSAEVIHCREWKNKALGQALAEIAEAEKTNNALLARQSDTLKALAKSISHVQMVADRPLDNPPTTQSCQVQGPNPQSVLMEQNTSAADDDDSIQLEIVGGCGLDISHVTPRTLPAGAALLARAQQETYGRDYESLHAIEVEGQCFHCFKLSVSDFVVESDDEYQYLLETMDAASGPADRTFVHLALAVMEGDVEAFAQAWGPYPVEEANAALHAVDREGMTLLHRAACVGNAQLLQHLLQLGADPLVEDSVGLSALHMAAGTGDNTLVKVLLADPRAGQQVHLCSRDDSRAIHSAVQAGAVDVVRALVDAGSSFTSATTHGMTPLLSACHHGHAEVALYLLEAGDNGVAKLEDGRTALHLAAEMGLTAVVRGLLACAFQACEASKDGSTALHWAARAGHVEACEALLRDGQPPADKQVPLIDLTDKLGITALGEAARHGQLEAAQCLLQHHAQIDLAPSATDAPLIAAIRRGHTAVACLLVETGGISEAHITEALELASRYGMLPLIDSLHNGYLYMDRPPAGRLCPAANKTHVAHALCRAGRHEVLRDCIASEWLPRQALALADEHGSTPFKIAVTAGGEKIVGEFVRQAWPGEDWQAVGGKLQAAARYGLFGVLAEELNKGPDLGNSEVSEVSESSGHSLAYLAARNGHVSCLKRLISLGADLETTSARGPRSVLRAAIESGNTRAVELVVRNTKFLPRAFPQDHWSPGEVAAETGDAEMVKFLYRQGAPIMREEIFHGVLKRAAGGNHLKVIDAVYSLPDTPLPSTALLNEVARMGRADFLLALLNRGALANGDAGEETTPLGAAIEAGHLGCLRVLLAAGAELRAAGTHASLFQRAADGGHEALLMELLEHTDAPAVLHMPGAWLDVARPAVKGGMIRAIGKLLKMGGGQDDICALMALKSDEKLPLMAKVLAGDHQALLSAEADLHAALTRGDEGQIMRGLELFHPAQQVAIGGQENGQLWPVAFVLARRAPLPKVAAWLRARQHQVKQARDADGNHFAHIAAAFGWVSMTDIESRCRNHRGDTPLMMASRYRHEAVTCALLAAGGDVDASNDAGHTALHLAAVEGAVDIIQRLLREGASRALDLTDTAGKTSLMLAIEARRGDAAMALLLHGANPNAAGVAAECRALHWAAEQGSVELVMALLGGGAAWNVRDNKGNAPIHRAAAASQVESVLGLLGMDEDQLQWINAEGQTALHLAARSGDFRLVALMAERMHKLDVVSKPPRAMTPLLQAAEAGHLEAVAGLFEAGAAIDACNGLGDDAMGLAARGEATALLDFLDYFSFAHAPERQLEALAGAAIGNSPLAVRRLVKRGMPVGLSLPGGRSALALACRVGSSRVACCLLRQDADASCRAEDGSSVLHDAVMAGSLSTVKLLLRRHPDLHRQRGASGSPTLHLAVESSSMAVVTCLLMFGADVDAADGSGRRAIDLAAAEELTDVVAMLLAFGSRLPEMKMSEGRLKSIITRYSVARARFAELGSSRLHIASFLGDETAVAALAMVDDFNERDKFGRTALHLAGQPAVARRLLIAGADVHAIDSAGATPMFYAVGGGHEGHASAPPGVLQALVDFGARPHLQDTKGTSPLLVAFRRADRTACEALKKVIQSHIQLYGRQLDQKEIEGRLVAAVRAGNLEEMTHLAALLHLPSVAVALRCARPSVWEPVVHNLEILRVLVECFQVPTREANSSGQNLLHIAALSGCDEAAVWLMAYDDKLVHQRDDAGYSPLMRAVEASQNETAARLVAQDKGSFDILRQDIRAAGHHRNSDLWGRGWAQALSSALPDFSPCVVPPRRPSAYSSDGKSPTVGLLPQLNAKTSHLQTSTFNRKNP